MAASIQRRGHVREFGAKSSLINWKQCTKNASGPLQSVPVNRFLSQKSLYRHRNCHYWCRNPTKKRKEKERKGKHIWREQGENGSKEPPTDIQGDFFALCDTYNAPDEKTELNPAIQTYSRTVTALRRGKGWTYQEAVEALKTSAKAYHKWKSEMDERPHNLEKWLLSGEYAKNYAVKPMPGKTGKAKPYIKPKSSNQ